MEGWKIIVDADYSVLCTSPKEVYDVLAMAQHQKEQAAIFDEETEYLGGIVRNGKGKYEVVFEPHSGLSLQDYIKERAMTIMPDKVNECEGTAIPSSRDGVSVNSVYNSDSNEKSVTVTARNGSADELMQILKLSGLMPDNVVKAEIAPVPAPATPVTGLSAVVVDEASIFPERTKAYKYSTCPHDNTRMGYARIGGGNDISYATCIDCGAPLVMRGDDMDWSIDHDAVERDLDEGREPIWNKDGMKPQVWVSPTEEIKMTCVELPNHSAKVSFILGSKFSPEPSRTFGTAKEALMFANGKAKAYGLERQEMQESYENSKNCKKCGNTFVSKTNRKVCDACRKNIKMNEEFSGFPEMTGECIIVIKSKKREPSKKYPDIPQYETEYLEGIDEKGSIRTTHNFGLAKRYLFSDQQLFDDMKELKDRYQDRLVSDEISIKPEEISESVNEGFSEFPPELDDQEAARNSMYCDRCGGYHDLDMPCPREDDENMCHHCHENEKVENTNFCQNCHELGFGEDWYQDSLNMTEGYLYDENTQACMNCGAPRQVGIHAGADEEKLCADCYKYTHDHPEIFGDTYTAQEPDDFEEMNQNEMYDYMNENIDLEELGKDIADHGRREEFHQRKGNGTMQQFHKDRRLELQKKYNDAKQTEGNKMNESLTPKRENTGLNGAPKTWQNEPNEQMAGWKALIQDTDGLSQPHDMFNPVKGSDNIMTVASKKKEEEKPSGNFAVNSIREKLEKKFAALKEETKEHGTDCPNCNGKLSAESCAGEMDNYKDDAKKSVKEGTLKEDYCVTCDKKIPSGSDIDQCKKCYKKDHPEEGKSKKKVNEAYDESYWQKVAEKEKPMEEFLRNNGWSSTVITAPNQRKQLMWSHPDKPGMEYSTLNAWRVAVQQGVTESTMKPNEITEEVSKSQAKKLQAALDSLEQKVKKLGAPPSAKTKISQSMERFTDKIAAIKDALAKARGEEKEESDEKPEEKKSEGKSEKKPFEKKSEKPSEKEESEKSEGKEAEPKPKEQKETASDKPDTNGDDKAPKGKVKDIGKGIYESEVERMQGLRNIITEGLK